MIKATLVHFERVSIGDNMTREFRVENPGKIKIISVASYSHGWATIVPSPVCYIGDLAELVEGCFLNGSNFSKEVMRAFEFNSVFCGIEFEFNEVHIMVNYKNFQKEKIIAQYNEGFKTKKPTVEY